MVQRTGDTQDGRNSSTGRTQRIVGILADPHLATDVAQKLKGELPGILHNRVSETVDWVVRIKSEALPLDEDGNITIWENSARLRADEGWDLLIGVTELTRRTNGTLLISDVSITSDTAVVSLPTLGPVRLRHHLRNVLVRIVRDMVDDDLHSDTDTANRRTSALARQLEVPLKQHTVQDDDGTSSSLALAGFRGRVRLLLGMVRVNRPWRLVPSLASALAAAVATGAFGIFYSTIWQMADSLSPLRLGIISVVAITAMVTWLIVYNRLWERPENLSQNKDAAVYNAATVLTLVIGVGCMYAVLFLVIFLGALTIIPSNFLESTLQQETTVANYLSIAWLASSLGTFAGALGSTFESDFAIRQATYGKREQERHARSSSGNNP